MHESCCLGMFSSYSCGLCFAPRSGIGPTVVGLGGYENCMNCSMACCILLNAMSTGNVGAKKCFYPCLRNVVSLFDVSASRLLPSFS